jgi:hypothetical protein
MIPFAVRDVVIASSTYAKTACARAQTVLAAKIPGFVTAHELFLIFVTFCSFHLRT